MDWPVDQLVAAGGGNPFLSGIHQTQRFVVHSSSIAKIHHCKSFSTEAQVL
jgi:hypothetical protein